MTHTCDECSQNLIMPDPVSLIGFSLGAISFVIGQISALEARGRDFLECRCRLQAYSSQLKGCLIDLEDWNSVWGPKYYTKKEYPRVWSEEGSRRVTSSLGRIGNLAKKIERAVDRPHVNSAKDQNDDQTHHWKVLLTRLRQPGFDGIAELARAHLQTKKTAFKDPQDVNAIKKIAFALYRNQKLLERITRLEKEIQSLKKISFDEYKSFHGDTSSHPSKPEEVQETIRSTEFIRKLLSFTKDLYEQRAAKDLWDPWALEIEPPPQGEVNARPWEEGSVAMNFTVVERDAGHGSNPKRVCLNFSSDSPIYEQTSAQAVLDRISGEDNDLRPDCMKHLEAAKLRSFPFKSLIKDNQLKGEMIYKSWAEDRCRLMLGFAHWMVLLWGVRWTSPPCSCGIRFETTHDSTRHHTFTADDQHTCDINSLSPPRLLLIGLVLAELILVTPLRVTCSWELGNTGTDSGQCFPHYQYEEWVGPHQADDWKPIGRTTLLKKVQDKTSYKFKETVKFCLDDRSTALQNEVRPGHILRLQDHIVNPYVAGCSEWQ
jgi:hypothetical protein